MYAVNNIESGPIMCLGTYRSSHSLEILIKWNTNLATYARPKNKKVYLKYAIPLCFVRSYSSFVFTYIKKHRITTISVYPNSIINLVGSMNGGGMLSPIAWFYLKLYKNCGLKVHIFPSSCLNMIKVILSVMTMFHLDKMCLTKACPLVQGGGNAVSRRVSPGLYDHGVIHAKMEAAQNKRFCWPLKFWR